MAWKEIDQLHEAALQISKQCFEYKKLCVGLIGAACVLIVKFTGNDLDYSLFVVGLLITLGFWIADANAYYFQRKVRNRMNHRMADIAKNNNLSNEGTVTEVSWHVSLLNRSMTLYYVLVLLSLLGVAILALGWIE